MFLNYSYVFRATAEIDRLYSSPDCSATRVLVAMKGTVPYIASCFCWTALASYSFKSLDNNIWLPAGAGHLIFFKMVAIISAVVSERTHYMNVRLKPSRL